MTMPDTPSLPPGEARPPVPLGEARPPVPVEANEPRPLRPVEAGERIVAVDALRGFALLGILLVNMGFFSAPFHDILLEGSRWPAWPDRAAEFAVRALAEGKFYVLFSLLFGVGMALQMQRAATRGGGFSGYYVRRLAVLFVLGAAHALLLWYGDILTNYALVGLLLLLFRRRKDGTVLTWAAFIYALPLLLFAVMVGLLELGRHFSGAGQIDAEFAEQAAQYREAAGAAIVKYQTGTWGAIFRQRLSDLAAIQFGWIMLGPTVATMFLLGLLVGRRGIFQNPEGHLRLLRGLAYIGLPVGLALNVAYAAGAEASNMANPTPLALLAYAGHWAGAPLLSFGYAAGLVLLLRRAAWQRRLAPLAAVGRMALTNYILQTVICTTIFYSFGLGLFGRVSTAWTVLLAVAIYAAQVPLSVWWLRRFRFGPLEWLWRTLTYGRPQPMRLHAAATA